jgi:hypothetical protein
METNFEKEKRERRELIEAVMAFRKTINVGDVLRNTTDGRLCKVTYINHATTNAFADISFIYIDGEGRPTAYASEFGARAGSNRGGHLPANHFTKVN